MANQKFYIIDQNTGDLVGIKMFDSGDGSGYTVAISNEEDVYNNVGSHGSNSSLSSAVTLTPPATATKLLIQALTQNIRITLDGTVPTASVGFQIKAGDPAIVIPIGASTVLKVIQETASASIQYQWGN